MENISSSELIKRMGAGWNAGNSLDACAVKSPDSETSWGNPPISKELIDSVCGCGFNVIRLPVTWFNHFTDDNFTISHDWLERVKEVTDFAYSNGAFVILNTHHENWCYTSEENYPRASAVLRRVWEQICDHFEGYSERLIFEGLNEPRKYGTPVEWNAGDSEARAVVNRLNKDFVRTVRDSGGNNSMRHLAIVTYCGSCYEEVMRELEIPEDDKIIVSVHSYKPWFFAAEKDGTEVFDPDNKEDTRELDETFGYMKKYCTDRNIPVIIDEFGTVNRNNTHYRLEHLRYMKKKSGEIGAKLVWWDNGYPQSFGLFDRKTGEPVFKEIIDELVNN